MNIERETRARIGVLVRLRFCLRKAGLRGTATVCTCLMLAGLSVVVAQTTPVQAHDKWEVRYLVKVQRAERGSLLLSIKMTTPVALTRLTASTADPRGLDEVTTCDGQPLVRQRNTLRAPPGTHCVRYQWRLSATARGASHRLRVSAPGVFVSDPKRWLWMPDGVRPTSAQNDGTKGRPAIKVHLQLEPGLNLSVPWPQDSDGDYTILPSPRSAEAIVAFGEFTTFVVPGVELSKPVAVLTNKHVNVAKHQAWLRAALTDVQGVVAAAPNVNAQVLLLPVPGSGDSPLPFGRVMRNGGETVQFFIREAAPLSDYLADWTATHEFAHLLLPYVRSDEKWVSEGFASYYQNILLARRGVYTEADMWRRLARSFAGASDTRNPPSPNGTRDRRFGDVRMLIYWSGAAMALMADVRLRELSNGHESLDKVLARLNRCCLPSPRRWRADELFATLDTLTQFPVFAALYEEYADRPGMPPTGPLFAQLGVIVDGRNGHRVALDDTAPLAQIRQALVSPPGGDSARAIDTGHLPALSAGEHLEQSLEGMKKAAGQ